jgi:Fungal protein kinase
VVRCGGFAGSIAPGTDVTHTHFDIESNPEWFACSVLFPLLLPSSELGLAESLSTIKVEDQEFILGDTLFRPRTDLIGCGTFVHKARRPNDDENNWPLCVKLSWPSEGRIAERTALVALSHLPGVVKLVAGQDEVDISHCRRNMLMERTVIFHRPKRRHKGSHCGESAAKVPHLDRHLVMRPHALEGSHLGILLENLILWKGQSSSLTHRLIIRFLRC